jgi:diguanylate cyclase (GGDEF)-like protein
VQGLIALLLVALAGVIDWLLGPDVPMTLGYLAPISITAWYCSRPVALACTVLAATTWLVIEMLEQGLTLHPGIHFLNFSLQFGLFLIFGRLVATLGQRLKREKELAHTDALTGLANRRAFWDRIEHELRRCRRFATPFAVAYVDVDDFKSVNDRCGHERGDQVLVRIAQTLRSCIRESDVAARIGGDEFALLLTGTAEAGAQVSIGRLAATLARARLDSSLDVTCSIGCLCVESAPASVDELVGHADALMYAAKRLGPGQVRFETMLPPPDSNPSAQRRAAT